MWAGGEREGVVKGEKRGTSERERRRDMVRGLERAKGYKMKGNT